MADAGIHAEGMRTRYSLKSSFLAAAPILGLIPEAFSGLSVLAASILP